MVFGDVYARIYDRKYVYVRAYSMAQMLCCHNIAMLVAEKQNWMKENIRTQKRWLIELFSSLISHAKPTMSPPIDHFFLVGTTR